MGLKARYIEFIRRRKAEFAAWRAGLTAAAQKDDLQAKQEARVLRRISRRRS